MLGRALFTLLVLSLVSEVTFANTIILPMKKQSYSWKDVGCSMQGGKNGADLTIESRGKELSGQKGAFHFTFRNFRSVMDNTPAGKRATLAMNDKTVGNVTFTENDGKVWGDVQLRDMSTSCNLSIEQSEDKKVITLRGSCEQLGSSSKKTGPRTTIVIDEIEPLTCNIAVPN